MKNEFTKWIAISVMLAIMSMGTLHAEESPFAGGAGTKDNPFLIETPAQLNEVRNYLDAHFALIADLDMVDWVAWAPIGLRDTIDERFTGSFDGRGHVIRNLEFTGATAVGAATINGTGLFGFVAPADRGVAIRNLGLVNFEITPQLNIAGILAACLTGGTVFNCFVDSSFMDGTGRNQVGGLLGRTRSGTVLQSWVNARVVGASLVGGLVGNMATQTGFDPSLVENCHTSGRVQGSGSQVGGIGGSAATQTIRNSYTTATVVSAGAAAAGIAGNVATQRATIENNVVLSDTIRSTTLATLNRIATNPGDTNLKNNMAWESTILRHLNPVTTAAAADSILTVIPADSLNGRNGQSITLAQASLAATYTTAPFEWNFENIWQIVGATDFPTFREIPAVTSVKIDSTITVGVGLDWALTWKITPEGADPTVWFESLDEDIATVTNGGVVEGESPGEVKIVIFAGKVEAPLTDTVTVTIVPSPMDSIRFNRNDSVLARGYLVVEESTLGVSAETFTDTLRWTRFPVATPRRVTLTSLDTLIARVELQNNGHQTNARGVVTGVGIGETKIIIHSMSDPVRTDTIDIKVREADVRRVEFLAERSDVVEDYTVALRWEVVPRQAFQGVTFESFDTDIVTVDAQGVITGVAVGETKVEISAGRAVVYGRDTILKDTVKVYVHEMMIESGDGTRENPFVITTEPQLNQVRAFLSSHFVLGNDIDMTDTITSIGSTGVPFTGSFDGDDHVIRNLIVNDSSTQGVGLFGAMAPADSGIAIQNLGLIDVEIFNEHETAGSTGALIGTLRHGTVHNSFVDGSKVTGGNNTGGLIGRMERGSTLSKSWANSDTVFGASSTGGLAGAADAASLIENCYVSGHVQGRSGLVAGVVGSLSGASTVRNVYATTSVRAQTSPAGGIAGHFTGGATITTSVSLAPFIRANDTNVYRIARVQPGHVVNLTANYALGTTRLINDDTEIALIRAGMDSVNGFSITMTTAQMQQTYTNAPFAWNFTNLWKMNPEGNRLPIFMTKDEIDAASIFIPIPIARVEASVFPNPTRGDLKVEVKDDVNIQQILVYSMSGQLVFSTTKPEFNIEKLRNGFYIIHVITDRGNFVSRIVKM